MKEKLRIVASLTTIPSRIGRMRPAIESILEQTVPIEKVELNIPHLCRRTGQEYEVPDWLAHVDRVEIFRTDDLGPITKVAPTLTRHAGNPEIFVWSCDDDFAYPANQLDLLMQHHDRNHRRILTRYGGRFLPDGNLQHLYGVMDVSMFESYGTVLFPPNCLSDDFSAYLNTTLENDDCRLTSDLVLSNYFIQRGLPIFLCNRPTAEQPYGLTGALPYSSEPDALHRVNGGHVARILHARRFLLSLPRLGVDDRPPGELQRVVRCIHSNWSGYLRLFKDGRSELIDTNAGGTWSLDDSASRLAIDWDEKERDEFRDVGGESVSSALSRPDLREPVDAPLNPVDAVVSNRPEVLTWRQKRTHGPTLGIVIPYRSREEHLEKLLPRLISFFRRDLQNSHINPLIVVSEQADDRKFNRGWCCNGGFLAVEKYCDYVCFHDVDYLPMWADYSYSSFPTQIIWWGLQGRPVRVSPDNQRWIYVHGRDNLGTIFVIDKTQFRAANGYALDYEGWGFEDADLRDRLSNLGIEPKYRDGTFLPLDHDSEGFVPSGGMSPVALENQARYEHRKKSYKGLQAFPDGLSTMAPDRLEAAFETWSGLDKNESLMVCRLRIGRV